VDTRRNTLSEDEIIAQAKQNGIYHQENDDMLLDALESFYMNGSADGNTGNVESGIGHVYRVHRWLVITDSQGFQDIETYDSESEAEVAFESYEREYIQWVGDDE
jgi:hypothetical protein